MSGFVISSRDRAVRYFKLTLAYDGTRYAGWQVQPGRETIQASLERAVEKLTGARVRIVGSGRTDAGVHAEGQVASFATDAWRAEAAALARALNTHLPMDIRVLQAADAPPDFHAIRDALGKCYRYRWQLGQISDPFEYRYRWCLHQPLEIEAMRQAAQRLIGRHDFASFQASGSDRKTTVRTVRRLELSESETATGQGGGALEIEADGFLYNMVRNIVGTLVEIGRGRQPVAWIDEVLAARNRVVAGPTAPPQGLCLVRVDYPSDILAP